MNHTSSPTYLFIHRAPGTVCRQHWSPLPLQQLVIAHINLGRGLFVCEFQESLKFMRFVSLAGLYALSTSLHEELFQSCI